MSRITYRCDDCSIESEQFVNVYEGAAVYEACVYCEGNVARVHICTVCDTREAECGCEECLECIADAAVDYPASLDLCIPAVQAKVAKVLAQRMRPMLSRRQAA